MANEVNALQITREDEANGGLITSALTDNGTRKKGRLAGGVRNKLQMAQMKSRMAALWRTDHSYLEIAETVSDEFGLPEGQRLNANGIHYHITQMVKYWREKGLMHIDDRQAAVLARYDQLEVLATNAYFASCEGRKTTVYDKQLESTRSQDNKKSLGKSVAEERDAKRSVGTRSNGGRPFDMPSQDPRVPLFTPGEIGDLLVLTSKKIKKYKRLEETPAGDPRFLALLIDINHKRAMLWGLGKQQVSSGDQELARLPDEERQKRLVAVINQALRRKNGIQENLAEPAPLGGFPDDPKDIPIPPDDYGDVIDVEVVEEDEDDDPWGLNDVDVDKTDEDDDIWG